MLILILIPVQYSQKAAVFSFQKGLNGQNFSSSGSCHPVKKIPLPAKCMIPPSEFRPYSLLLFEKPRAVYSFHLIENCHM